MDTDTINPFPPINDLSPLPLQWIMLKIEFSYKAPKYVTHQQ